MSNVTERDWEKARELFDRGACQWRDVFVQRISQALADARREENEGCARLLEERAESAEFALKGAVTGKEPWALSFEVESIVLRGTAASIRARLNTPEPTK